MNIYINKKISLSKNQVIEIYHFFKNDFLDFKNVDLVLINKWTNEQSIFETFFKKENLYVSNNDPLKGFPLDFLTKDYKEI